ncbi:Initiation factor 2 subunit [Gracilaria domingensis]|nr:Initiation factor 2 subunit [Gracilaria domingensis]
MEARSPHSARAKVSPARAVIRGMCHARRAIACCAQDRARSARSARSPPSRAPSRARHRARACGPRPDRAAARQLPARALHASRGRAAALRADARCSQVRSPPSSTPPPPPLPPPSRVSRSLHVQAGRVLVLPVLPSHPHPHPLLLAHQVASPPQRAQQLEMPSLAAAATASTHSQSIDRPFRTTLQALRHTTDDPRETINRHIASVFPYQVSVRNPTLRAQRDAVQAAVTSHAHNDDSLYQVATTAMDSFLAVRINGARAKVSAFFDLMCRDRQWSHIAVYSGSTVVEACFLALNYPTKRLTVIDSAPDYPGRALASRLASQTSAFVRYATLSAAAKALESAHVLVIGAKEVCLNGTVLARKGAGMLVQMARENGLPIVVATQAIKYSDRMLVARSADGDVIKPSEISAVVTELDTAQWGVSEAPEVLRRVNDIEAHRVGVSPM